ncbi:hypothetical protein C1646_674452 [Rhizophagus diaphanus]|nr:hypothetical protein C1646_674452 [Rhizophagus diaphanus] [Rhizophagus sp. MUCL 43196]
MDYEMQKYDQWGERTQHRGARQKGLLITISEYTYERIEHGDEIRDVILKKDCVIGHGGDPITLNFSKNFRVGKDIVMEELFRFLNERSSMTNNCKTGSIDFGSDLFVFLQVVGNIEC